jgi:hypothetical protein
MAGFAESKWRSRLETGNSRRHQPLWSWLVPTALRQQSFTTLAPLLAFSLWLVGVSSLCWVLLWVRPPAKVTILQFVAGYQSNLLVPHNVPGVKCAEMIQMVGESSYRKEEVQVSPPIVLRSDTDWQKEIRPVTSPVLVVNFFVSGSTDEKGPFLLPDDSGAAGHNTPFITIASILETLKAQPASQIKVLVLDSDQPDNLWHFGILDNLFSEGLAELSEELAAVPNLVVVNSCSPGETSLRNHDRGLTNFGAHLVKALSGQAKDLDLDGEISLHEAFEAAASDTSAWASSTYGKTQNVRFFPESMATRNRLLGTTRLVQAGTAGFDPPSIDFQLGFNELKSAWERHARLAAESNAPEAICPDTWDHYQRSLLRYESLVRFGDLTNALTLQEKVRKLENTIVNLSRLSLESASVNLWMPFVAGGTVRDTPEDQKIALELLSVPDAELEPKLKDLLEKGGSGLEEPKDLRLSIVRSTLQVVASSPNPDAKRIERILRLLEVPGRLRPTEVQSTLIFIRDRAETTFLNSALQFLIRGNLLAEQCACGLDPGVASEPLRASERGAVFISGRIAEADRIRLTGQDMLLSGDPKTVQSGIGELRRAERVYLDAAARSGAITRWMNQKNRMEANLPFYTMWVSKIGARRTMLGPYSVRELEDSISAAWDEVHKASFQLENAVSKLTKGGDFEPDLAAAEKATEVAGGHFQKVQAALLDRCNSLAATEVAGENELVDQVLEVPDIDTDLRMRILQTRIPETVLGRKEGPSDKEVRLSSPVKLALDYKTRKAILPLRMIGQRLFDDSSIVGGADLLPFETCLARLSQLPENPVQKQGLVIQMGYQIRRRLEVFQRQSDQMVKAALVAPVEDRLPMLVRSDILDRIANLDFRETPEGGGFLRRAWINHFLAGMAMRAWESHLDNVIDYADPFYKRSMRLLLADSAKGPQPFGQEKARALLEKDGSLELVLIQPDTAGRKSRTRGPIYWTGEERLSLEFEAGPKENGKIPAGIVTLEVNRGKLTAADGLATGRLATVYKGDSKPGENPGPSKIVVNFLSEAYQACGRPLDRVDPEPVRDEVRLTAIFRGQRIPLGIPFQVHRTPTLVRSFRQFSGPSTVGFRVTEEDAAKAGQAKGSISILIDCSGSMGPSPGSPGKIAEVAESLEKVLGSLPSGIQLTVWVFGQAEGPRRTVDVPEDGIRVLLGPTVLGEDRAAMAKRLADRFRSGEIVPWNKSPIFASMAKAAKAMESLAGEPGPKTMLILTDGADNCAESDKALNPEKLPSEALIAKILAGTGISVRIIGYRSGDEEEKARKDFSGLTKLSPPGTYVSAQDLPGLITEMEKSLRREILFQLEDRRNLPPPGMPPDGYPAALPGFADKWVRPYLSPGEYLVRAGRLSPPVGTVRLGESESILLGLRKQGGLRRLGMAEDSPSRPRSVSSGWTAALLQNRDGRGSAQRFAILEKDWNGEEFDLAVARPGLVWWDCDAGGKPVANRVVDMAGYPSPSWAVNSTWWPADPETGAPSRGALTVWWSETSMAPAETVLVRGKDFKGPGDLRDKSVQIGGSSCLLESVSLENRLVLLDGENAEVKPVLVLRTRIDAPKGDNSPQIPDIRLGGPVGMNREVHLFGDSGKTTTIFWPFQPSDLEKLEGFRFSSLTALKKAAASTGRIIRIPEMGQPDANDVRPRPALDRPAYGAGGTAATGPEKP